MNPEIIIYIMNPEIILHINSDIITYESWNHYIWIVRSLHM